MAKLMIGNIMFKSITTKVFMEKLMIIKLIMAKPAKTIKWLRKKKTMIKLIMIQLTISK